MNPPESFDFPFPPYDIQHEFMKNLYNALTNEQFGIFESPTGTGKSLSIICGSIRWLKDYVKKEKEDLISQAEKAAIELEQCTWEQASNENFIEAHEKQSKCRKHLNSLNFKLESLSKIDEKIAKWKNEDVGNNSDDSRFEVVEKADPPKGKKSLHDLSVAAEEPVKPVQIFIASRTHTQLSQLAGEINKSPFKDKVRVVTLASRQCYCINPDVRKLKSSNLINEACLALMNNKDTDDMSEEELFDDDILMKKKIKSRCPYYKSKAVRRLTQKALLEVTDIEDLVQEGKLMKACPYYASRKALDMAEVVLVPYNTILHKPTREAYGINLKNNVVIIDEAHNLLDALTQMYSSEVSYYELTDALAQLKTYREKYSKRFSANTIVMINRIVTLVSRLKNFLEERSGNVGAAATPLQPQQNKVTDQSYKSFDFLDEVGIEMFNFFEISKLCREKRLANKLHSIPINVQKHSNTTNTTGRTQVLNFLTSISNAKRSGNIKPRAGPSAPSVTPKAGPSKAALNINPNPSKKPKIDTTWNKGKTGLPTCSSPNNLPILASDTLNDEADRTPSVNPLVSVLSFLECLKIHSENGRFIVTRGNGKNKSESKIRYMLLNATTNFIDLSQQVRSVIVAGGTMKPMEEFRERLFVKSGIPRDKIVEYSFDHVIPSESILTQVVTTGYKQQNLLFSFEARYLMGECLAHLIADACTQVKGGVVVFFPCYAYEEWMWNKYLCRRNFGRRVFREPRKSGSVESVLKKYSEAVYSRDPSNQGALLFSVVGGKLSEGLNFSDDLGRLIIVVGLPYPNAYSAEMKEKMAYITRAEGRVAAKVYYDSLCFKAVNQCIGRAVRHKNDHACVWLVDDRFKSHVDKLPGWIQRNVRVGTVQESLLVLQSFFRSRLDASIETSSFIVADE